MKQYRYVYEEGKLPEAFKAVPFVQSFDKRHWRTILSSSLIREYESGETLIEEGERDCWIYILLAGSVAVRKGETIVATIDTVGEVFGEVAVMSADVRSATIVARQPTVCLAIDWSSVEGLAEKTRNASYVAVYRVFVNLLASRLRDTTRRLADLGVVVRRVGAPRGCEK